MSEQLVSVVIPAFNAEKTLSACVESLFAQSWQNLQIIIVNDGSKDGTQAVAEALAARDARVTVISTKNGGVSAARNAALDICRGEYIRFADADDLIPPDGITSLVRRIEETGADLVIAGHTENMVGVMRAERNLENSNETVDMDELLHRLNAKSNSFFYGALWNKLFRRELIERSRLRFEPGLFWGEDFVFVCAYLIGCKKVAYMKESVYEYCRNPGSMCWKQVLSCVTHPLKNIQMKVRIYRGLRDLYIARGAFGKYRRTLWLYLVRVTINQ